ncbi:MAG: hypothetical protein EOO11_04230 [Chitinophagaceae bacterium]|nr:MAG: hypothetical protein EOO11_04230 [Chitinophagaceae bacterium]
MISRTASFECCFNNFPKAEMQAFPKACAFVYIQKVGVPYYANTDHYTPGARFTTRNNAPDRAAVASKVLDYLPAKLYPKAGNVAVLGHSEGSDVAARLAVLNKRVTHLGFASGNGTPQLRPQQRRNTARRLQAQPLAGAVPGFRGFHQHAPAVARRTPQKKEQPVGAALFLCTCSGRGEPH